MRMGIALILSVVLCSGCAMFQTEKTRIYGAWKPKRPDYKAVLTMNKDNTYEVDWDADGRKDIWGEFSLTGEWVVFRDKGGKFDWDCGQEGAYYYAFKGHKAIFTLIADQCPYRAEALAEPWVRTKKSRRDKLSKGKVCGLVCPMSAKGQHDCSAQKKTKTNDSLAGTADSAESEIEKRIGPTVNWSW